MTRKKVKDIMTRLNAAVHASAAEAEKERLLYERASEFKSVVSIHTGGYTVDVSRNATQDKQYLEHVFITLLPSSLPTIFPDTLFDGWTRLKPSIEWTRKSLPHSEQPAVLLVRSALVGAEQVLQGDPYAQRTRWCSVITICNTDNTTRSVTGVACGYIAKATTYIPTSAHISFVASTREYVHVRDNAYAPYVKNTCQLLMTRLYMFLKHHRVLYTQIYNAAGIAGCICYERSANACGYVTFPEYTKLDDFLEAVMNAPRSVKQQRSDTCAAQMRSTSILSVDLFTMLSYVLGAHKVHKLLQNTSMMTQWLRRHAAGDESLSSFLFFAQHADTKWKMSVAEVRRMYPPYKLKSSTFKKLRRLKGQPVVGH